MKKGAKATINVCLTLLLAITLLGVWLAVPSPAVNEAAEDRYMEQSFGE